jgi:hypothetical protein
MRNHSDGTGPNCMAWRLVVLSTDHTSLSPDQRTNAQAPPLVLPHVNKLKVLAEAWARVLLGLSAVRDWLVPRL